MEKERKIAVNVCLPLSIIEKVDVKRGQTARSEFLRDFILQNLDLSKIKTV